MLQPKLHIASSARKSILTAIIGILVFCTNIYAARIETNYAGNYIIYPADLWKGVLAEAAGEGYEGMYAVCCVVRNRLAKGMSHGLVGMERSDLEAFVKHEYKVKQLAIQAIRAVFEFNGADVTNGARHFESIDFIKNFQEWEKNKRILAHIGKHYFYNYWRKN